MGHKPNAITRATGLMSFLSIDTASCLEHGLLFVPCLYLVACPRHQEIAAENSTFGCYRVRLLLIISVLNPGFVTKSGKQRMSSLEFQTNPSRRVQLPFCAVVALLCSTACCSSAVRTFLKKSFTSS